MINSVLLLTAISLEWVSDCSEIKQPGQVRASINCASTRSMNNQGSTLAAASGWQVKARRSLPLFKLSQIASPSSCTGAGQGGVAEIGDKGHKGARAELQRP